MVEQRFMLIWFMVCPSKRPLKIFSLLFSSKSNWFGFIFKQISEMCKSGRLNFHQALMNPQKCIFSSFFSSNRFNCIYFWRLKMIDYLNYYIYIDCYWIHIVATWYPFSKVTSYHGEVFGIKCIHKMRLWLCSYLVDFIHSVFMWILTVNPLNASSHVKYPYRATTIIIFFISNFITYTYIGFILTWCTPFSIYSHHFHLKISFISYGKTISIFTLFAWLFTHRLLFFISVFFKKTVTITSKLEKKIRCSWVQTKENISPFFWKLQSMKKKK